MISVVGILEKALPVFVMLGIGMLCRNKRILTRDGISALKSLVVNITLPAVMFSAFASAEYSASSIYIPLTIFLACTAALLVGFACCRLLKIPGRLSPYISAGFEAGMLGYALFAILFPGEKNSHFAIIDLGQVLFVFTLYKALLAGDGGLKGALREAAHSPTVWAIVAGLIVGASGLYNFLKPSGVSAILDSVSSFVSAPTSAVILLTVGYDLSFKELHWRKTLSLSALRIVVSAVMLGILLLINQYIMNGIIHTGALILMLILPPPYVLPIFADVEEERTDISSTLSLLTLVSILLFVLMVVVFA